MRALMRECLGLLAVSGLGELLEGKTPVGSTALTYQEFAQLRPKYAGSSWRVTLGKLVERRLVIKSYQGGGTTFQMAKHGWQEFKALNPVFSASSSSEWMLCLYVSQSAKKTTAGQARRLLDKSGYTPIQPGVAIKPNSAYTDYLPQELRQLGYIASFFPFQPGAAQPVPVAELYFNHDRLLQRTRECEKISKEADYLLMQLQDKKKLKNQTKERIGSMLVSGLSFISGLNWLDLEMGEGSKAIRRLIVLMDNLMHEYAVNIPAWRE